MPDIDYKMLCNLSPLPIYVLQGDFFRLVNPKMCEISGYNEEDLLKVPFAGLIQPEDRHRVVADFQRHLSCGGTRNDEFRAVDRQGRTIHLRGVFTLIEFGGEPAILGQVMDVTGERLAVEELRKSEERYRLLLENIEDGYYEVDLAGNLLQCNDATSRIFGVWDRAPFIGINFREYMDEESARAVFEAYNRVYRTLRPEKGLLLKVTRDDGVKRILEASVSPFGEPGRKPSGFRGILRDITKRKEAEEKLKLNEARLEALLRLDQMNTASIRDLTDFALEEGVRLTGSDMGLLAFLNSEGTVLTMHSWSKKALEECAVGDRTFVYPVESTGLWGEAVRQKRKIIVNDFSKPSPLKKGLPPGHADLRRVMFVPVFDQGKIVLVAGVANKKDFYDSSDTDQLTLLMSGMWRILQRRRASEILRASEERFSKAFHASPVMMSVHDLADGRYMDVNSSFLQNSGYSRDEVVGKVPSEIGIYTDPVGIAAVTEAILKKTALRDLETTFRAKSGEVRTGLLSVEIIELNGKERLLSGFYDITDRKKMEEQLKYLSLHDPLTGLYNRAYFEEEMRRLEKVRQGRAGVIVCDVDGLKHVNDTRGHAAGDRLLVAAARTIRDCFRGNDMVSRIGGDEFAVLLPGCDREAAESACSRIRQSIARYNETNPGFPLSISVGYATGEAPPSLGEAYREADNNMYREKLHRSQSARSAVVQTLVKALEARDFITEGHADRMQYLVEAVARNMGLPEHKVADLCLLAQFHDIGKVGIPDSILFKRGPLAPDEVSEMRRHCEIGHLIAISPQELTPVADWILKHHEWWNGKGYPLGLKGEEIPLECRILAIADAYDAMTNDRPYRRAMTHGEAVEEIIRCAGTQFDPRLVEIFIGLLEEPGMEG